MSINVISTTVGVKIFEVFLEFSINQLKYLDHCISKIKSKNTRTQEAANAPLPWITKKLSRAIDFDKIYHELWAGCHFKWNEAWASSEQVLLV